MVIGQSLTPCHLACTHAASKLVRAGQHGQTFAQVLWSDQASDHAVCIGFNLTSDFFAISGSFNILARKTLMIFKLSSMHSSFVIVGYLKFLEAIKSESYEVKTANFSQFKTPLG